MSFDPLIYDMSQVSDVAPSVFVKKDWLNILDNQSQNYSGNQCVIDTSQLANSNKYMNYREAYLSIPLLLTLNCTTVGVGITPVTAALSCDYVLALKNWSGSLIHSLTLDYNGTTIVQQTGFQGIYNTFKLYCSLSMADVVAEGASIGFWPDDPLSFQLDQTASSSGIGISNNRNAQVAPGPVVTGALNSYTATNSGIARRQMWINYDTDGLTGVGGQAFSVLNSQANINALYKASVLTKINGAAAVIGVYQQQAMVQVKLKHLHSFFDNVPLLKGVFMRLTLNLNNTSFTFSAAGTAAGAFTLTSVSAPYGGVNPLMLCSALAANGSTAAFGTAASNLVYIASVAVGSRPLASGTVGVAGVANGTLASSVTLNVPAYSFNSTFEASYLSQPVKKVDYTDIYQYLISNISATNGQINSLVSNGIAGIKSVLVVPFFSTVAAATGNTGISVPQIQSPYDTAGTGTTAPLALLTNFNVVIAGQNMIYNTQRYAYEQFMNQLYGYGAINGGQTDGLASGLIDSLSFETSQCFYYVNCSRMLPVEESIPKSVSIIGQNSSSYAVDLFVFVEYSMSISIDCLTGARV
jgi:hypothetical protein